MSMSRNSSESGCFLCGLLSGALFVTLVALRCTLNCRSGINKELSIVHLNLEIFHILIGTDPQSVLRKIFHLSSPLAFKH